MEDCDFSDIEQGLGITASISFDEFKKQIESLLEEAAMNNLSVIATIENSIKSFENIQSMIESYKADNQEIYESNIEWFSNVEDEIANAIEDLNDKSTDLDDKKI